MPLVRTFRTVVTRLTPATSVPSDANAPAIVPSLELQPPSPDWGLTVSQEYTNMISGIWWPTLFPALAIASTVIAVNLIADSLQSVLNE